MLSKTKKLLELYYTFGNKKNVWLNRRPPDSLCYVIFLMLCYFFMLFWFKYMKKVWPEKKQPCSWKRKEYFDSLFM